MSRIRTFSRFSLGDLVATAGPAIVLFAVLCATAYVIVDPAPPRHVVIATGQENSAYEQFGKRYAQALAWRVHQVAPVPLVRPTARGGAGARRRRWPVWLALQPAPA